MTHRSPLPFHWRGGTVMRGQTVKRGRKWSAVVYLGVDPETGRKRRKWISGFDTQKEAQAYLFSVAASPAFGSGVGPRGSTRLRLGDFLDRWLRTECRKACGDREWWTRECIVRLHLKPRLGHIPLAKLAPGTVEEFFASTDSPSANHWFKVLRAALNHAVRLGLILSNPCGIVGAPRSRKFRPTLWAAEETLRFLVAARTSRNYALWLTEVTTGLRLGELLGLRWRDVDLGHGVLRVVAELERPKGGGFRLSGPKTDSSTRSIRLDPVTLEELRDHRRRQVEGRLRTHDLDFVFCQPNGNPLHSHNLTRREFASLTLEAKVPRIRFHDLRHCHGTLLAEEGVNLKAITERMGHSTEAFTLSRYIHSTPDMQEQAVAAVSRRLFESKGNSLREQVTV